MIAVGTSVHDQVLSVPPDGRRALLARVADAGLDHVVVADHVSFHGGTGFDGMVGAAAALATEDRVGVLIGVYQLALRHPMTVARALASLSELAPGRLTLGVGVGGEDRSEVSNCGVDPATRGRRIDEALTLLRRLATGEVVDHDGEFFRISAGAVLPAQSPPVPILIGGKSEATIRRTAEHGDGWLGMFVSARRFAEFVELIRKRADELGRPEPDRHGFEVWCGLAEDPATARELVAEKMQRLYKLPFEKFERLCPAGTPAQVADFLRPYVEAGARSLTLVPCSPSWQAGVDAVAEVRALLSP
ncbi:TIGR03854 family LLM class F420-dependent oxidoreductase [Pseudonocardia eucalypti]|uniref:TIGR03854 family LLM class F420-dependent oxidoreductase n=1 Tax=Pseudonocardia eucalypti TaxID=648755 RepID=A0ABP9RAW3_9PSEU|nr:alkanesulfonate monooxygenase SsuD/methylene tetrahydromethanopterin reductase-like flavin-dependent oxidoreductase (luciferase family) [Pseudonocardia eucalypti]